MKQIVRTPLPLLLLLLLAGLWNLDGPPMWWDEGWTLSVARNVTESGAYARLLNGELAASGLEAAVPVTKVVAASFGMFGVGIWQGRLPLLLLAILALGLLWLLTQRLFDSRIAWATLAIALLLAPHPQVNIFIQGRQVLAEAPMLVALLAGLLCADAALRRTPWLMLPAVFFWAIAASLKAQTLPFLLVGLLSGCAFAAILKQWRSTLLLLASSGGIYVGLQLLYRLYAWWAAPPLAGEAVSGLYDVTAVVFTLNNRSFALSIFLLFGLLTASGLAHGTWRIWLERRSPIDYPQLLGRTIILGIASSWLAWFLLLSVGVPRYMFPAVFLATPFAAVLLDKLTNGFRFIITLQHMAAPLRERRVSHAAAKAWLATILLILTLPFGMLTWLRYYVLYSDDSAQRTVAFFQSQTSPTTRIETYESELHFLLNQPYHWPPDQTHVELNRRSLLGQQTPIDYDPLTADPDYLVVGEFARGNMLYQPLITDGTFRLLQKIGGYEVYQRVR
jgi:hypothetical protein